jgi:hypothetical protein
LGACLLLLTASACQVKVTYPNAAGTLFIRQQICDLHDFKTGFFKRENDLKGHGFLTYSFHRDPQDPKTYILAFKCSNLKKAADLIGSSNFYISCVGAGLGLPLVWAGVDVPAPPNQGPTPKEGGIVVGRYKVRDYGAWKRDWDAANGDGKTRLGRGFVFRALSQYRAADDPNTVIVVYGVSDVPQARANWESDTEKNTMESAGVTKKDLWFGADLEEGSIQ